jgi:capping protein alpha
MSEFEEEISDAERLQIAQHFLMNSPPAQYGLVSGDVKKLLPAGCMPDQMEKEIAKKYNFKNNRVVKAPSGKLVALHEAGGVDDTHCMDSSNGAVFKIDHLTMEISEAGGDAPSSNQDSGLELKRAAVGAEISSYVEKKFSGDAAAGSVYAKDGVISIAITGERSNLRNMYSGKWSSSWKIESIDGSKATISGEIKIHNHYFEEGNIQLQTNKPVAAKEVSFSSEKELGEKVVEVINNAEQETQVSLHDMIDNAHVATLKELRKASTVHKVKMQWNQNSVKMVGQLTGKPK